MNFQSNIWVISHPWHTAKVTHVSVAVKNDKVTDEHFCNNAFNGHWRIKDAKHSPTS